MYYHKHNGREKINRITEYMTNIWNLRRMDYFLEKYVIKIYPPKNDNLNWSITIKKWINNYRSHTEKVITWVHSKILSHL